MLPESPQLLYIILVLPSLFGLVLIGDGINKLVHDDSAGVMNVMLGLVFFGIVVFAFFFFTVYLK